MKIYTFISHLLNPNLNSHPNPDSRLGLLFSLILTLPLTLTLTLALQATITITPVQAVDNGVGRTPAMGWNSWNHFQCGVNEVIVRETVNALVTTGLRDVGYTYVNIDDCWQAPNRSDSGEISPDPVLFPSGFYSLSKYIHSYGFKFGIYSDAGPVTCDGRPGSRGYEYVDAQTYAKWEVDYLKYDNCYADASDWVIDRYTSMGQALNATGRPILFAMCEWGVRDPWNWAPMIGNSWRVDNDIQDTWDSLLRCLDNTEGLSKYAKPGAFNDPDMLEVGNGGMKIHEYQAHFALWCLLKSPLLIGADVRNISADALAILKAKEVIALNQDPLGIAGDRVAKEGPHEVWAAPMFDGSRGVVLFNRHTDATQYPVHELTVQFTDIGYKANTTCVVRDLYLRHDLGMFVGSYTGPVYVHGVLALRITPINEQDRIEYQHWRPWH